MTDEPANWWDEAYEGDVPWDIGRPQSAIVRLAERGEIVGDVLDVGCGTGTHALSLASRGHRVTGIDISSRAVERAREKLRVRREREPDLDVTFRVGNALDLELDDHLGGSRFETVVDSGTFHVFEKPLRGRYADSLATVLESGGRAHVLVFSDRAPPDWGPTPVAREDFAETFADGWRVLSVREEPFETTHESVAGYLATLERL
ncbi:class I SAM-dependent methyltransferase [Halobacteria archaeon AArc-m2/3/4]|uniref:Class I SAM-dependent methyltransferase n=1 Tax=Natronoglomus mannanivorans TaxID=2979990 RepID=A0AAP2YWB6_9EURY|nr:class I SAM-dependent methyltransferase [Halobacteria archaeon AArc-xg1-1]MCU4971771.1 class I SAM-dependent methyltransferase [Halobacteria archaeon AArc-m2/3/4]